MGYEYFQETFPGRRGSVDAKFQRTFERVFIVKTDSPFYGPYYAGSHPSLPLIRSAHPEDPNAYCSALVPVQSDVDPTLWTVTASYVYYSYPGEGIPDPLARPTEYEIDGDMWPEAVFMDRVGNAICNSAGDPFLPPVEMMRTGCTITVEFNLATPPTNAWIDAQGTVNASTMVIGPWTFGAELLKLLKVRGKKIYETATAFWRWTLVFQYRPFVALTTRQGHKTVLLDQGRREKISGVMVPIVDPGTGIPTDQPVPLNGLGRKLPVGAGAVFAIFDTTGTTAFPTPL